MRLLHAADTPLSTHEISERLNQALGGTSHHLHVLRQRGLVALVAANENGETYYVSRVRDQATVTVFLDEDGPGRP
jgi:Mn-dependent DtxR family transcriptional regulator